MTDFNKGYVTASPCTYADHNEDIRSGRAAPNAVACRGAATFMVHDKRGCRVVCIAHAKWRSLMSRMPGHSQDCPLMRYHPKPGDIAGRGRSGQ